MKYFVILRNYQLIPNRNSSISEARLQNAQNIYRRVPTYLFASNRHCVAQLNYPISNRHCERKRKRRIGREKPKRNDDRKKREKEKNNAKSVVVNEFCTNLNISYLDT